MGLQIISISLDSKKVGKIDEAMKNSGIKSRSKYISNALEESLQKQRMLSEMKGENTVVFNITHAHTHKSDVTAAIHGFEHIVKTVVHHHSKKGCLDILIVEGEAESIRKVFRRISSMKGVGSVNCSII